MAYLLILASIVSSQLQGLVVCIFPSALCRLIGNMNGLDSHCLVSISRLLFQYSSYTPLSFKRKLEVSCTCLINQHIFEGLFMSSCMRFTRFFWHRTMN